jgi:hypothetical protein
VSPRPRAPYVDVRIETPRSLALLDGLTASGLATIDFHPHATGPEIELTFGVFGGHPLEGFEAFVKGMVEQVTGQSVLAIATRNPDDPDPATGVS